MGYRISVDVGGTFTDLTVAEEGHLVGRFKSPTTPDDLITGVFNCLELAAESFKLSLEELLNKTDVFIHASTTATNAILEGKGAKCGLICTAGTKYTLWRGEGRRKNIFNFKQENPKPLIRPYLCLEVTERVNSEGEIVIPLNEAEVRAAVRQLKEWNVKTIAVCLLWSILNKKHEQRIGEIIEEEWPGIYYCLSSELQPIIREYHRMSCTVLNSMTQPIVSGYLEKLLNSLKEKKFSGEALIVISTGSIVPFEEIIRDPVFLLYSGPAMGPVSGAYFGEKEKEDNVLVVDMGGTSFDISTVIDNQITTTRDARILHYPTGLAATEILTLGAGGGSIGWVDSAGRLMVGPQSSGAIPGPACYLKGGTEPTVTDACVVLGYIVKDQFLGGAMEISPELAYRAIKNKIADRLSLTVEEAAMGIYQVCKENLIGGILDMTVRKGINPKEFTIVTGGGATGIFAAELARELGVRRIIIPKETAELCAFGALNSNIAFNIVSSKYTSSAKFDFDGINKMLDELKVKGNDFLSRQPSGEKRQEFFCSARYPQQVTELEIPIPGNRIDSEALKKLTKAFHDTSLARYKTCDPDSEVEFVMWRHVATNIVPEIELPLQSHKKVSITEALRSKQLVFIEKEKKYIETPCYDGDELHYGMHFNLSTQRFGYFILEQTELA